MRPSAPTEILRRRLGLPNEAGIGVQLLARDGATLRRGLEAMAAVRLGALRRRARPPPQVSRADSYSTLPTSVRAKSVPTKSNGQSRVVATS